MLLNHLIKMIANHLLKTIFSDVYHIIQDRRYELKPLKAFYQVEMLIKIPEMFSLEQKWSLVWVT